MEKEELSFFEKLKSNPFLVCLIVIVVGVAAIVVYSLYGAMEEKMTAIDGMQAASSTAAQTEPAGPQLPQNVIEMSVQKHSELIDDIVISKEANRVAFTVTYVDEEALREAHYTQNDFSFDVIPVFYFYVKGTQVEIPGEISFMTDGITATYYLSQIDDLINIVALVEDETLTLNNVLEKKFNLYICHKSNDGVGRTLCGTYNQTVEEFNASHSPVPAVIVDESEDIKLVKATPREEFVWLDIYFKDAESYKKHSSVEAQHFICYGYEYGGKLYKYNFLTTEYDDINMIRCKVDKIALSEILKAMSKEDEYTVDEFFGEFNFSVWSTDYETELDLFCINEAVEIRERLKKSTLSDN